jgi:hypothetical protein
VRRRSDHTAGGADTAAVVSGAGRPGDVPGEEDTPFDRPGDMNMAPRNRFPREGHSGNAPQDWSRYPGGRNRKYNDEDSRFGRPG